MPEWSDYQEEVAEFFRSLGLAAETNVTVRGVRTNHNVDVVVRSKHVGFEILWLIECKAWKAAVPKEKVLALRSIVEDTGADRGFLMAESGYQSGALETARLTNVVLTSLADLKETLAYEIGMAKLNMLLTRADRCRNRYWAINKYDRIELGLRPEAPAIGYSGDLVIRAVEYTVHQVMLSGFPISYDRTLAAALSYGGGRRDPVDPGSANAVATPSALFDVLNAELVELEQLLDEAERALAKRDLSSRSEPAESDGA
jgi:restriction system protein